MKRSPIAAVVLLAMAASACTTAEPAPEPTPTSSTAPPATEPATTVPDHPPLVSIPVGPDGVEYAESPTGRIGPSLLTADPDGGIHIHDPVGTRILSFAATGEAVIDLAAAGIAGSITALGAASDHLLVVETYTDPLRQTAHRLEYDGRVRESLSLPASYSEVDGLTGVRAGTSDEIIVEYGGGAYYGAWIPEAGDFQTSPALSVSGIVVTARPPDLVIDGVTLTADLAGSAGSLRYLGTAADGTHAVIREEVMATGTGFSVLLTIEWYSPDVAFVGSARLPDLQDQAIPSPPGVALLPDGRAVALIARSDAIEVVELVPRNVRITGLTDAA